MSVPMTLPNGTILVYGWGHTQSASGVIPTNQKMVFGSVYQIWDGGQIFVYGGDSVMWEKGTEICQLAYSGRPYTYIEAKLVTKEIVAL